MNNRSFFDEFIREDFFEKKASENTNIKSALSDVTPSLLEKLAEEIGALSENQDMTLEQKLASDCSEKSEGCEDEEAKEEKKEAECEKKEAECEKEEEADSEKKEAECEPDKSDEEANEKAKEEDKEAECESDKSDEKAKEESKEEEVKEEAKEAECEKDEADKEADEEEEVVKKAYELAEQKLAMQGYGVRDYVFNKCASEDVSDFIAEYAEKLASLSDRPALQVADEIIQSVIDKIG